MNTEAPRDFFASMDHEEKLFFVTANGNAASFAYKRLHMHLGAARAQMARIGEAAGESRSIALPEPGPTATYDERREYVRHGALRMQPALAEVHFYFVSWAGCRNMLQILVGQPEFLEAKKVFDGYRAEFEHYVAGRNSFEHFHDRLPGQGEEHRVKEIKQNPKDSPHRVFWGFRNGNYIHSNLEWDISPASCERLERYVGEILAAVHLTIDTELVRRGMSA